MLVLSKVLGCLLLAAAGTGAGVSRVLRQRRDCRELEAFCRLLAYLLAAIQSHALPGDELLQSAARWPDFRQLHLDGCAALREIPLPRGIPDALRRELCEGLRQAELLPREAVCRELARLLALCRSAGVKAAQRLLQDQKLYPRLGFCAGALLALFFA